MQLDKLIYLYWNLLIRLQITTHSTTIHPTQWTKTSRCASNLPRKLFETRNGKNRTETNPICSSHQPSDDCERLQYSSFIQTEMKNGLWGIKNAILTYISSFRAVAAASSQYKSILSRSTYFVQDFPSHISAHHHLLESSEDRPVHCSALAIRLTVKSPTSTS